MSAALRPSFFPDVEMCLNLRHNTDAEGHTFSYTYDGNGNMLTKTDADGYVTEYSYNSLDLVSHINYNDAKEVSYQYNKVGELVKMDDWLGTTTFEVEDRGTVLLS